MPVGRAANWSDIRLLSNSRERARLRGDCLSALAGTETPEILHTLGLIDCLDGAYSDAIGWLKRACQLSPGQASWHNDLAVSYLSAGKYAQACTEFETASRLAPASLEILLNHADAMFESGRLKQALKLYRQAVRKAPASARAHRGLGRNLASLGFTKEAHLRLQESIRLAPSDPASYSALASLYTTLNNDTQNVVCRQKVVRLRPADPVAWANLAAACRGTGEIEKAIRYFQRALALDPNMSAVRSVYLNTLLHDARISAVRLADEHREWGRRVAALVKHGPGFNNPARRRKRLRIGYVTSEIYSTAESHFRSPFLLNHDPSRVVTYGYCGEPTDDQPGREFFDAVHHFRNLRGYTEEAAAEFVRKDRIDILVDLSGHLPSRLLPLFARRAAPVQVSFPAHPATSGLRDMDYFVTDEWTTPRGLCDDQFTEKLYYMPSGHLPYAPPRVDIAAGPLPAQRNGFVTFGVLQRPTKMSEAFWDTASMILRRAERSRLLIHHSTRDYDQPDGHARMRIIEALRRRGIAADRLEFRGRLEIGEHLKLLRGIDIALDTWPYNGQTTTCECLWMGIPVVTLSGVTYASRVSRGILLRTGLDQWIAESQREYVNIAVRHASALPSLANLRKRLRRRLEGSTLFRYQLLARELEDAYEWMWEQWRLGKGPRA